MLLVFVVQVGSAHCLLRFCLEMVVGIQGFVNSYFAVRSVPHNA